MGKATNYRVVAVAPIKVVVVTLPCVGGLLFLVGSFCFWPDSSHDTANRGALAFLIGSFCYWGAPFLDYWELTHNLENLADRPLELPVEVSGPLHAQAAFSAALYEQLYKAHVLRLQRVNSLIFMAGGTFFIGGSTLFFPIMEDLIAHGGWLYITGCMLVLLAALLGTLTAYEMRKTAQPCAAGSWSDEEATMLSCAMYVLGNLTFIVGSVFFFPRILEAGGPAIRLSAVWLFVLGSVIFFAGARAATRACRLPRLPRPLPRVPRVRRRCADRLARRAARRCRRARLARPPRAGTRVKLRGAGGGRDKHPKGCGGRLPPAPKVG